MDSKKIEKMQGWATEKSHLAKGFLAVLEQVLPTLEGLEGMYEVIGEFVRDEWLEEYWFAEFREDISNVQGCVIDLDECLDGYLEYLCDLRERNQEIADYGEDGCEYDAIELSDYGPYEDERNHDIVRLFVSGKMASLVSVIEERIRDELRTGGEIHFHQFLRDIIDTDFYQCIEDSLEYYSSEEESEFDVKSFSQLPNVICEMAKHISLSYRSLSEKLKEQLVDFYRCYDGLFPNARRGLADHE